VRDNINLAVLRTTVRISANDGVHSTSEVTLRKLFAALLHSRSKGISDLSDTRVLFGC